MGSGGSSQALGLVAELIHRIILSSAQICTELFLSHAFASPPTYSTLAVAVASCPCDLWSRKV